MSAGAPSRFRRTSGVRTTVPAMRSRAAWIASSVTMSAIDLDLRLDLHGNAKRQLRHAHCRARVLASLRSPQRQDQVRASIDDGRLEMEAGRGIDHPEDTQPVRYAVQIAQLALQTAK